ncbi:hypothetical protein GCM10007108_15940 [Thermogymnomonas acidicola]|uniref:Uncharacterized protein n=1 Tax=Thermogymnomonas acidicola TaxID=399579 RepID=A0AA37BSI1_9ARCH|nr:hypothetical protein [Thermogymnomonas acidicola]GGM78580.1 hypothetical protein GCM10007108_15940 [Thermogymnomonas acidicola]
MKALVLKVVLVAVLAVAGGSGAYFAYHASTAHSHAQTGPEDDIPASSMVVGQFRHNGTSIYFFMQNNTSFGLILPLNDLGAVNASANLSNALGKAGTNGLNVSVYEYYSGIPVFRVSNISEVRGIEVELPGINFSTGSTLYFSLPQTQDAVAGSLQGVVSSLRASGNASYRSQLTRYLNSSVNLSLAVSLGSYGHISVNVTSNSTLVFVQDTNQTQLSLFFASLNLIHPAGGRAYDLTSSTMQVYFPEGLSSLPVLLKYIQGA